MDKYKHIYWRWIINIIFLSAILCQFLECPILHLNLEK